MNIKIGDLSVGPGFPPFIVAELSGNHNGSLARALEIVDAIARSGAQAVKLQTYTADTITIDKADSEFVVSDPASPWHGRTLYSLYREAATPWEWHAQIMARARELRLACFSTPFDESAVDFLETLDVPAYKIASFENVHLPLIRKTAATGKPLIISTGMASIAEIDDAVRAAREGGCRQLVLLKCTSTYPASPLHSNVMTIPHMRALFDCQIGLSDHTMGIGAAVAAVAHGASVIEKHVTLNRAAGGVDSAFSLEPEELRALVLETERAWQSLGRVTYGPNDAEKASLVFRRSIYVAQDVRAGDALTRENIRCIRPGLGLAPKYYDILLGRRIKQNVARGTPLSWELVE